MTDSAETRNAHIRSGLRTIRRVAPYLWPRGETWLKCRVILALLALLLSKLVAVGTPFFFKAAVDALAGETPEPTMMLAVGAIGLTVAYGFARLMNVGFQQLRDVFLRSSGSEGASADRTRDVQAYPSAIDALSHNPKNGWIVPDHRAWRQRG